MRCHNRKESHWKEVLWHIGKDFQASETGQCRYVVHYQERIPGLSTLLIFEIDEISWLIEKLGGHALEGCRFHREI